MIGCKLMQAQTKIAELTQLPENGNSELNLACFTHLLADLATVVKCEVIPQAPVLGAKALCCEYFFA